MAAECRKLINFGITGPDSIDGVGTNAKMNEFEAAMGLCVLDEIDIVKRERKTIGSLYRKELRDYVQFQEWSKFSRNNYSYAPILLSSEEETLRVIHALENSSITPRRYFYPSLDTCNYSEQQSICKNSRDISSRILCLPIYPGLSLEEVHLIIATVKSAVENGRE